MPVLSRRNESAGAGQGLARWAVGVRGNGGVSRDCFVHAFGAVGWEVQRAGFGTGAV